MTTFFVFSNGFSGTRTMSRLLSLSDNVDCGHERKEPKELFGNLMLSYLDVYHGGDAKKAIEEHRVKGINYILDQGKHFGEVSGFIGYYVDGLFSLFPDAKFIHMYRDPKTHIISSYNRGLYIKNDRTKFIYELWQRPEADDLKWKKLSRIEKCCWYWTNYNTFVMDKLEKIPEENQITIKFEDFTNGVHIEKIFGFLGLILPSQDKIQEVLNLKLGGVDYKKISLDRKTGDCIYGLNDVKQKKKLEKMYVPVLKKLENKLTWK